MKKIALLISLLVILIGYAWARPLLAQAPEQRPRPEREALDAAAGWSQLPEGQIDIPRSTRPLVSTRPEASYAWSKIVYQDYTGGWDVYVMNGDGYGPTRLTNHSDPEITPRLNRGATRVAYVSREPGNYEIYVINPNGTGRMRLTNNPANDYNPAWSPNGTKIAFNSYRDGQSEVYVMNADGSGQARLTNSPDYDGEPIWSPDGMKIAFVSIRESGQQIYTMNADGSNVTRLTMANAAEFPTWSLDGSQVAFSADSDGDGWLELATINTNGSNQRFLYDTGGQADFWAHTWSPDGRAVVGTLINFINYQGNWYWVDAYVTAWDVTTNQMGIIGASNTAWYPDWQSTDLLPPTSSMTALPTTSPSPIVVRWSGSDAGTSGIRWYDVQVNDGTGTWTQWLTQTTATTANYSGISGHTYSFRVRAVDNSSNAEVWPANAQASTTVETLPPTSAVSPLPAYWRGGLTVTWGGSDPGGSGIATYDVQYRDGEGGTWTDWQLGTTASSATYNGTVGHTYTFRARAIDRAQNLGEWSIPGNAQSTTFYSWQIRGMVLDGRDRPVVGASVAVFPSALNTITSTASGYKGYLLPDSQYILTVTHPSYGMTPPTTVGVAEDQIVKHVLPPSDNALPEGSFEQDPISADWESSGIITPSLTDQIRYAGGQSIAFGRSSTSPQLRTIDTGQYVSQQDSVSDAEGNLYVVWDHRIGGDPEEVYYAMRTVGGSWSTPLNLTSDITETALEPKIAVDNSGTLHVVWHTFAGLWHSQKPVNGTWSDPSPITTDGIAMEKNLVIDSTGTFHIVDCDNDKVWYLSKPVTGTWSDPVSIGTGRFPVLTIGPDDALHVVWRSMEVGNMQTMYARKLPGENWSSAAEIPNGSSILYADIAVDTDNTLHLVWTCAGGCGVLYTQRSGNAPWTTPVTIASGNALQPDLEVSDDNTLHLVYYERPDDFLHEAVLYMMSDGTDWSTPEQLSTSRALVPVLNVDALGRSHILWLSGDGLYYYGPISTARTGDMLLTRSVVLPNTLHEPTLSFLYMPTDVSVAHGSWFDIKVSSGSPVTTVVRTPATNNQWSHQWLDMSAWAGQQVTLTFRLHQTLGIYHPQAYLDEVSLGSWLTPDPQSVEPKQVSATASTIITITGDNFIAPVQVRLDDTPLPDATWVNTNTIIATIPVLPFGRYDVIVTNPGGQTSGLADALLVGYEVYLPIIHK